MLSYIGDWYGNVVKIIWLHQNTWGEIYLPFASKFQGHGGEVFGSGRRDYSSDLGISGVEDVIKPLL